MLIGRGLLGSTVAFASAAHAGVSIPWEAPNQVQDRIEDRTQQFMELPRQLHAEDVRLFRNFMGGRVYSTPHHHYHTVYRLPVDTPQGVIYRPYFYCGDTLQLDGDVVLPHLAIRVQIGSRVPVYDSPVIVHSPPVVVVTPAAYHPPAVNGPACHATRSNHGHHYGWNKQDHDDDDGDGEDDHGRNDDRADHGDRDGDK
jgi:hypothetical protein